MPNVIPLYRNAITQLLHLHILNFYIFKTKELLQHTPGARGMPLAHSTIMFAPHTVRPFS